MVQGKETKVASLVLTLIVFCLLCLPIDVSAVGVSQGCTLWQRLCYSFFHANIIHAAVNCWCLLSICFARPISIWQLVVAYIIASTYPIDTLSAWYGNQLPTVGLSGVIFALLGIISVMSRKWWLNVAIIGSFIMAGFFLPHINATLHLYCYLVGLLVGLFTTPISWKH